MVWRQEEGAAMDGLMLAAVALGAGLGSLGYVVGRFVIWPVGRYRRLRAAIARELGAAAPGALYPPEARQRLQGLAVDLAACAGEGLPAWYRQALRGRGEDPQGTVALLQRLAGTADPAAARRTADRIRRLLRLPGGGRRNVSEY
jgi:hypothetical protein